QGTKYSKTLNELSNETKNFLCKSTRTYLCAIATHPVNSLAKAVVAINKVCLQPCTWIFEAYEGRGRVARKPVERKSALYSYFVLRIEKRNGCRSSSIHGCRSYLSLF